MRSPLRVFFLAIALTGIASAQQPQVLDGQVSTQAVAHGLHPTLDTLKQSSTPLWVGYSIPTASPFESGWNSSHVSHLERRGYSNDDTRASSPVSEQDHAIILFRLAAGKIDQVRAESPDRQLDAGGLRFVWLTGVTTEDSIAVLKAACLAPDSSNVVNSAVFLISIHRSDAAMPALIALAGPGPNLKLREQSAFWLANQRGHEGFVAIQTLVRNDKDDQFRQKLTFNLTLSKDPGALPELVRMAHEDSSPKVRGQAQFWMASRGGKIVAGALRDSANNDADAATRKQAVFAMTRLPDGEATTQLIQLADNSKYPEVRKQAIFWLGQSQDPKALDYLTKLVTSPSR